MKRDIQDGFLIRNSHIKWARRNILNVLIIALVAILGIITFWPHQDYDCIVWLDGTNGSSKTYGVHIYHKVIGDSLDVFCDVEIGIGNSNWKKLGKIGRVSSLKFIPYKYADIKIEKNEQGKAILIIGKNNKFDFDNIQNHR